MTRDEAARFLREKLSTSKVRNLHVFLTWNQAREIIVILEGKAKTEKVPLRERIRIEEENKAP